jgi:hypothetical protein
MAPHPSGGAGHKTASFSYPLRSFLHFGAVVSCAAMEQSKVHRHHTSFRQDPSWNNTKLALSFKPHPALMASVANKIGIHAQAAGKKAASTIYFQTGWICQ